MAATALQIAQVRRMAGVATGDTTYTDIVVGGYIEAYPLIDERGESPYTWDTSTEPPTQEANDDWVATYDLHAAAADVLEERAAALAGEYDFSADGASYHRSQAYEALMKQCRYHRARRTPTSITLVKWPEEDALDQGWIGNLAEPGG
jgi:hypothetical protein